LRRFAAAHESYFAKKPSNLTHTQAAALPLVSITALHAFRQHKLEEGKNVLITGGYVA
jgi:NADPH:quinone reductase-like Zn-dependent oxidoreductase